MAKTKSRSSSATLEKKSTNVLMQQFYDVRSEINKVTWPTREEARSLSIAVTVGTVVIAIFLFMVDFFFEGVLRGIVTQDIIWIIVGVVAIAFIAVAFVVNSREV